MDQKKQDLNPELKQIYDRVMNTQVSRSTPNSTPPPPPSAPSSPQTDPLSSTPAPASQPFLSSAPPRTLPEKKSFVFTGSKVVTPHAETHASTNPAAPSKQGMPGKIIPILVVVLIVVWGIFWAKIFGLF